MSRLIVSAGLHRSGSTWLYNVLRIAAGPDSYACFRDQYDPSNPARIHIVKAHTWNGGLANAAQRVVMSYRDLRSIAASAVLRGLSENRNAAAYIDRIIEREWPWSKVAHCLVQYEHAMRDPIPQIARALKAARLEADAEDVFRKVTELEPPTEGRDPVSLLHANHFTLSDDRAVVPKRQIQKIVREHRAWLERFRYLREP